MGSTDQLTQISIALVREDQKVIRCVHVLYLQWPACNNVCAMVYLQCYFSFNSHLCGLLRFLWDALPVDMQRSLLVRTFTKQLCNMNRVYVDLLS